MKVELEYGDGVQEVDLPDRTVVVPVGPAGHEPPPLADPVAHTRAALREPLGSAPLAGLVRRGSRVTIAFPDRVKGGAHGTAHRKVSIPLIVAELERAGVRRGDITLVCATGLHRKNRREEFEQYLGREVLDMFGPAQIINHDAEDPAGIVGLPDSELGDTVQVNRLVTESDLTVLIGHTAGNPYGGFSGGYKMPATGLTTWRSIRRHHTPATMHRGDFLPVSTGTHFRRQLTAIGQRMEAAMPQPFFAVDAVIDSQSRQLGVFAGAIPEVERASWPLAGRRTAIELSGGPADVLVVGVPRSFHYGNGMGSNPILMTQAIGAALARARAALRPHPVVIATAVCDGWFNKAEFPAYRQVFELLGSVHHPAEMVRLEEEVCAEYEWIYRYRYRYGYHPFHAFSMVYMGALLREHAAAVYIAGARKPGYARAMGAIPVATVGDALREASRHVGADPRILAVPGLSKPAYHVAASGS